MTINIGTSDLLDTEIVNAGREFSYDFSDVEQSYESAQFHSFDFEAMSEVPLALEAFNSHQQIFGY